MINGSINVVRQDQGIPHDNGACRYDICSGHIKPRSYSFPTDIRPGKLEIRKIPPTTHSHAKNCATHGVSDSKSKGRALSESKHAVSRA